MPSRLPALSIGLALIAAAAAAQSSAAAAPVERRCGWLVNETPGNFELDDRQGQWTISEQGGYTASGFDRMPDMSTAGWIETNGPHGHGCACLSVTTERQTMRVTRVYAATPVALKRCRSDRRLPTP